MVSFAQLWEQLEKSKQQSPLMGEENNGPASAVLKAGQDLRKASQTSFWDELISLCKNADGLSELLGVSREQIASWPAKIKDGLSDLDTQAFAGPEGKQNRALIPTGMTGAITTNQDPNIGEIL